MTYFRQVLTLIILLWCLYQAGTKGWVSFVLLPLALILLPLLGFLHFRAIRIAEIVPIHKFLDILAFAQLLTMTIFFTIIVGAGDTNNVYLFGFMTQDIHAPIVGALEFINTLLVFPTLVIFVWFFFLVISKYHNEITNQKQTNVSPSSSTISQLVPDSNPPHQKDKFISLKILATLNISVFTMLILLYGSEFLNDDFNGLKLFATYGLTLLCFFVFILFVMNLVYLFQNKRQLTLIKCVLSICLFILLACLFFIIVTTFPSP